MAGASVAPADAAFDDRLAVFARRHRAGRVSRRVGRALRLRLVELGRALHVGRRAGRALRRSENFRDASADFLIAKRASALSSAALLQVGQLALLGGVGISRRFLLGDLADVLCGRGGGHLRVGGHLHHLSGVHRRRSRPAPSPATRPAPSWSTPPDARPTSRPGRTRTSVRAAVLVVRLGLGRRVHHAHRRHFGRAGGAVDLELHLGLRFHALASSTALAAVLERCMPALCASSFAAASLTCASLDLVSAASF